MSLWVSAVSEEISTAQHDDSLFTKVTCHMPKCFLLETVVFVKDLCPHLSSPCPFFPLLCVCSLSSFSCLASLYSLPLPFLSLHPTSFSLSSLLSSLICLPHLSPPLSSFPPFLPHLPSSSFSFSSPLPLLRVCFTVKIPQMLLLSAREGR